MRIDNGALVLTFLPSVGGRLVSLLATGQELLWRDLEILDDNGVVRRPRAHWPEVDGTFGSWVNVGGAKTWPAPQGWGGAGEWAGPPDAVIDSGAWAYSLDTDLEVETRRITISLTSPDDPRTGLRMTREFFLEDGALNFVQRSTFTNVSDRTIRWSIWEVVQVDTARSADSDALAISVAAESDQTVDLGSYHGSLNVVHAPDRIDLAIQDVVAKIGFPSATGSISYTAADGLGLRLDFAVDKTAEYPDGGSRAEIWMQAPLARAIEELSGLHPRSHLVELEALGPLVSLEPGESTTFEMRWSVLGAT